MEKIHDAARPAWASILPLFLVVVVGFMLRLYSFHHTYVPNLDGILYIQQAKAICYGQYDRFTACFRDITMLPFFIAGAYKLVGDWVRAGQAVSVFFGTITLLPLYLLLRRFFDRPLAICALLIFAVNPIYVGLSADIIRDSIYWFFVTLGLYFFSFFTAQRYSLCLVLSCASFLLASWTRYEGMIFVVASAGYLFFSRQEHRWRKVVSFLCPLMTVIVGVIGFLLMFGRELGFLLYQRPLGSMLAHAAEGYQNLRAQLDVLNGQNLPGLYSPYFFNELRNLLWWLALGALLMEIPRALFEPFFLIFIIGLVGLKDRLRADTRVVYLLVVSVLALIIIYLNLFNNWVISKRFIATFMFPSFVVFGYGLERIVHWGQNRLHMTSMLAYMVIGSLIVLVSVPKNLTEQRTEKVVFKDIGQYMAAREGNSQEILVAGSRYGLAVMYFYANLAYESAECSNQRITVLKPGDKIEISSLRANGVRYLVWDGEEMPVAELDRLMAESGVTLEREWQQKKLGRIVLFRVKESAL